MLCWCALAIFGGSSCSSKTWYEI